MSHQRILGLNIGQSKSHQNLTYEQFVADLSKLDKTELLSKITQALWYIWSRPAAPEGREEDYSLARVYLSRVAAIAAAVCGTGQQLDPIDEAQLTRLAGELLGVKEAVSERSFFEDTELPLFTKALQAHPVFENHIPDEQVLRAHAARLTLIRTLRAQWDFRAVGVYGILRSWSIVRLLNERYEGRIFKRLTRALNIEPQDYVRAGVALYSLFPHTQHPGALDIKAASLDTELARTLNLDLDALLLVASRMSRESSDFMDWHQGLMANFPDPYRKYVPHPLVASSLIHLDHSFRGWSGEKTVFLCPSPPHLLWRIQSSCIDAVRDLPVQEGENLLSDLGECLEDYLYEFLVMSCGRENVVRVNKELTGQDEHAQERHADFIVLSGELALVIESKTSLGSTLAKAVVCPGDVVSVWSRLCRAYQQCAYTIKSTIWKKTPQLARVSRFASIVCFDEILCPEGAAFNGFAVDSGLWTDLGINSVEAVSLQDFEELIFRLGAKQLAELIQEKWYFKKHDELLSTYFRANHKTPTKRPQGEHLRAAAEELFPGAHILNVLKGNLTDVG